MPLDPHYLDVYLDVETRPAPKVAPWWPKQPAEIPFYELWLDEAKDRPVVRKPEEVKAGNRKDKKRDEFIAAAIAEDEAKVAEWERTARTRYDTLIAERDAALEKMRAESALSPFMGGEVACIGLAIGEEGKVQLIHPDNDPANPPRKDPNGAVVERPEIVQHRLWLFRHREYRMLKRLSRGIQANASHGLEPQRSRHVRIIAWNGYRFDFQFLALRAAALAQVPSTSGEPVALKDDLDERGYDRDLLYLCAILWHTVSWKTEKTLVDPRVLWSFGENTRYRPGRLPDVARFFGVELNEEILAMDHSDFPRILEKGRPEEREQVYAACADDVRMLQGVHSKMIDLGVGWGVGR